MERDTPQNIVEIKDLSIAAYLYSTSQVKYVGKRRLSSGDVLFQFSTRSIAEQLISDYWNLSAPPIQPKQLFNAMRDLKDIIFAG
ncbi:MAG: hypothetical protein RI947_1458 [Candidatus Parcubacteria bacterium]|jgi:hypothetical protein